MSDELQQFSMTLDEVATLKRMVTADASYAPRFGVGLALRLLALSHTTGDDASILFEINALESETKTSSKAATPFKKHPALRNFWHKHFIATRHLLTNIGERWGVRRGKGNKDINNVIEGCLKEHAQFNKEIANNLSHLFVLNGLADRVEAGKMTGDWIIFGIHEGQKYYLDVATHEEGDEPEKLLEKLRRHSEWEFPFLFSA